MAPSAATPAAAIVALKYTPPKKASIEPKVVQVAADGTITGDGKPLGKIASTGVVDSTGKTTLTVTPDGIVSIAGNDGKETLKFSPTDELMNKMEGGTWHKYLVIGDDGAATMNPGTPGSVDAGKFEGMVPSAKREGIALILALVANKASAAPSTVRHEK